MLKLAVVPCRSPPHLAWRRPEHPLRWRCRISPFRSSVSPRDAAWCRSPRRTSRAIVFGAGPGAVSRSIQTRGRGPIAPSSFRCASEWTARPSRPTARLWAAEPALAISCIWRMVWTRGTQPSTRRPAHLNRPPSPSTPCASPETGAARSIPATPGGPEIQRLRGLKWGLSSPLFTETRANARRRLPRISHRSGSECRFRGVSFVVGVVTIPSGRAWGGMHP